MATRMQLVTAGPSKHDLLVLALGEGQEVDFTFNQLGRRKVTVASVTRFGHRNGGNTKWTVGGYILLTHIPMSRENFQGQFDTQKRDGHFYFSSACAACGHDLNEEGTCEVCINESRCVTCCKLPDECECFS